MIVKRKSAVYFNFLFDGFNGGLERRVSVWFGLVSGRLGGGGILGSGVEFGLFDEFGEELGVGGESSVGVDVLVGNVSKRMRLGRELFAEDVPE